MAALRGWFAPSEAVKPAVTPTVRREVEGRLSAQARRLRELEARVRSVDAQIDAQGRR